jgi:REP element-mobilizing transposase RayT
MSDDIRFRDRYRIPSARLANWDYRWAGVYSLTICTRGRVQWFGEIVDGQMALSPEGRVVAEEWSKIPRVCPRVTLDEWIIMPDHLHGILVFQGRPTQDAGQENPSRLLSQSLGAMVGQLKSKSTKRIRMDLKRPDFAWQARFYDTVLRKATDLDRVRAYIRANPSRWKAPL